MIKTWAWDIECMPNFFSVIFVNITDYLKTFEDCCDINIKKGKEVRTPIPLVQKLKVSEIVERLNNVEKKVFYFTDTDDHLLLQLLGFISSLEPYRDDKGTAIRNDVYGYNSARYDRLMINALLMYHAQVHNTAELTKKLYEISVHIISMQDDAEIARHDYLLETLRKYPTPFTNVDVMSIFALNKVGKGIDAKGNTMYFGKSLKQTSINLQWYELLEYQLPPIDEKDAKYYNKLEMYKNLTIDELNRLIKPFDRFVLPEWIEPTIHYNCNDVYIVCEIVRLYMEEIKLRYSLCNAYGVDVLSSSRSKIADTLFVKFYSDFSNLNPNQWRGKTTERTQMSLNKVIFPFINFKTPELQLMLEDMKNLILTSLGKNGLHDAIIRAYDRGKLKSSIEKQATEYNARYFSSKKPDSAKKIEGIEIKLNNLVYTIATGGLHSQDIPRALKSKIVMNIPSTGDEEKSIWDNISDDSYIYVHYDIASFYPSLMIAYNIAPAHINKGVFVKLVKWLRDTRVNAKHSTEEYIDGIQKDLLAQALKIVINSIYGKLGFEKGDICDRLAVLQVTINGQLMVMMLCEELELNGIEVVSANTDGIVVKLYKNKKEIFDKIANNWLETTKLEADNEEYKAYINRDINNYIAQEINGKCTFKGAFNPKMYAVDLQKGYDMPIVAEAVYQYFINDVPILETLYKCKNILDFCKTQNVARSFNIEYVDNIGTHKLQRNVRFYVSNNGGIIYKVSPELKSNLCSGQKVIVLNTLDDKNIEERDICYQYYYNEVLKIIDPIRLNINIKQKANNKTNLKSGKQVVKKYSGMYKSLFDDAE